MIVKAVAKLSCRRENNTAHGVVNVRATWIDGIASIREYRSSFLFSSIAVEAVCNKSTIVNLTRSAHSISSFVRSRASFALHCCRNTQARVCSEMTEPWKAVHLYWELASPIDTVMDCAVYRAAVWYLPRILCLLSELLKVAESAGVNHFWTENGQKVERKSSDDVRPIFTLSVAVRPKASDRLVVMSIWQAVSRVRLFRPSTSLRKQ